MGCSTPDAPPKAASRNGRDGAAAPPRHAGKEADIHRKEKRSSPLPYLGIGAPHQRRKWKSLRRMEAAPGIFTLIPTDSATPMHRDRTGPGQPEPKRGASADDLLPTLRPPARLPPANRSEERRVEKERVSRCRSRCSPNT